MQACPSCKSRVTKIFNLSTGLYRCQLCDHEDEDPLREPSGHERQESRDEDSSGFYTEADCGCGKRECSQCGEDPAAYAGT